MRTRRATLFGSFATGRTLTFAAPITGGTGGVAGTKTLTLFISTDAATVFNGVIGGGGGTIAVTKSTGTGTLALNGANTFTGALTIDEGTLVVPTVNNASTAGPLGNSASAVSLNGALEYTGGTASSSKRFSLGSGTFRITSAAADLTLSAVIDGTFLTKTGPGTLTLTAANTYTAQTTVAQGTLKLSGAGKLGAATAFLGVEGMLDLGGTSQTVGGLFSLGNSGLIVNNSGGGTSLLTSNPTTFNNSFTGVIADNNNATAGTVALTKGGAGFLTLTGANTYSGATTVSDGVLTIFGNGTLGNTVGATTVASGGTLRLNVTSSAENITISGVGYQADEGALEGYDTTYSGLLTLGASATVYSIAFGGDVFALTNPGTITAPGATKALTLSGSPGSSGSIASIIGTGTGTVTVSGGSIWTLTGANTFSGALNVSGNSRLVVPTVNNASTAGPLGQSATAVTLNNSTLEYTGGTASSTKTFALPATGVFQINSAATDLTLSGIISGTGGGIRKTGPGTLTLTAVNTYTAGTDIQEGLLKLSGSGRLGTTAGFLLVSAGATLDLGGTSQTVTGFGGGGTILNNGGGASVLTSIRNAGFDGFSGVIADGTGTVAFTKSGTGYFTISGANTYSGLTTITDGTLVIAHAMALGSSANGTSITSGGTLAIQGGITVGAEALTIRGAGDAANGATGALENVSGTNNYGGLITLGAASTISSSFGVLNITNPGTITGPTFDLTLTGAGEGSIASIIGTTSGDLIKNGTGKWTLTGANTYTGTTTISAGILNIQNANALGASTSNDTTITAGATLQIEGGITTPAAEGLTVRGVGAAGTTGAFQNVSGNNTWAGDLTLGADSTISSDDGLLTITNAGTITGAFDLTLNGFGDGAIDSVLATSTGTLIKTGSGKWTLSALNTYTAKTFIREGTLEVNTLKNVSGGSSSLGAPTTAANGTIDMGNSTNTGILRFIGTADATSNRVINLAGSTGGATLDSSSATNHKLVLTSAFTATGLGDKTLTLTGSSTGDNEITAAIVNSTGFATAVTKSGSGNWKLSGASTYTGDTSVTGGTLTLTNPFLANAADVNLTSGATLNLIFAGNDTIDELRIDGVAQSAGSWGSLVSSATFKTALITGTGILNVSNGPAAQPYASWAAVFPLSGANYPFDTNPDRDGIDNGFEWILGGNPLADSASVLPVISSNATHLFLTFTRHDGSESSSTLIAQWGTDLPGSWNDVPVGAVSSGPDGNGVTVTVTENGAAADAVMVTIPSSLGALGRLFVSLKATMP